jgi:hypothetical protein
MDSFRTDSKSSSRDDPAAQEAPGMDRRASTMARDTARWLCLLLAAMGDPIIQRVEQFRCSRGGLVRGAPQPWLYSL